MKYHPLFTLAMHEEDPAQAEKAALDIGYIHIFKVVNGRPIIWGPAWQPEQLGSLDTFQQIYGGGSWEARARGVDNKGVINIVRFETGGPEKPCPGSESSGVPSTSTTTGQPLGGVFEQLMSRLVMQQVAPQVPSGLLQNPAIASAITAAITGIFAYLAETARARSASEALQMQLFAQMGQNSSQGQVALITALTGGHKNDGGLAVQESFMKGIEAMGKLVQQGKESGGEIDWMGAIQSIAGNLKDALKSAGDTIRFVNNGGTDVAPETEGAHTEPATQSAA